MLVYRITGQVHGKSMFLSKWLRSVFVPGLTLETVHASTDRVDVSFLYGCTDTLIGDALHEIVRSIPVMLVPKSFKYEKVEEFQDVAHRYTRH